MSSIRQNQVHLYFYQISRNINLDTDNEVIDKVIAKADRTVVKRG